MSRDNGSISTTDSKANAKENERLQLRAATATLLSPESFHNCCFTEPKAFS